MAISIKQMIEWYHVMRAELLRRISKEQINLQTYRCILLVSVEASSLPTLIIHTLFALANHDKVLLPQLFLVRKTTSMSVMFELRIFAALKNMCNTIYLATLACLHAST